VRDLVPTSTDSHLHIEDFSRELMVTGCVGVH
jgi:hypothetical protein